MLLISEADRQAESLCCNVFVLWASVQEDQIRRLRMSYTSSSMLRRFGQTAMMTSLMNLLSQKPSLSAEVQSAIDECLLKYTTWGLNVNTRSAPPTITRLLLYYIWLLVPLTTCILYVLSLHTWKIPSVTSDYKFINKWINVKWKHNLELSGKTLWMILKQLEQLRLSTDDV